MSVKLFVYDRLDDSGKPRFQSIVLDDEDAERWVQVELERTGEFKTAQQIQDDIDREFINSDRREFSHRAKYRTFCNEDGVEVDIVETIPSEDASPLEKLAEEQEEEAFLALLKETLNERYFDVLLKIIIGGQSIESYAKENGLGIKSVYNLLARSKEAVRKKYSEIFKKGE